MKTKRKKKEKRKRKEKLYEKELRLAISSPDRSVLEIYIKIIEGCLCGTKTDDNTNEENIAKLSFLFGSVCWRILVKVERYSMMTNYYLSRINRI